jgi:hypothetical protein
MFKLSAQFLIALIISTAFVLISWRSLSVKPALSETPDLYPLIQSTLIATASAPPNLVPSVLGGRPIYVLYVTRSEDTVLVRCYPGYEPAIAIRAMGSNPNANTQKEGVMTCRPSK